MRAQILAHVKPPKPFGSTTWRKEAERLYGKSKLFLGEVDPVLLEKDNSILLQLKQIALMHGLRMRTVKDYYSPCLLPLAGSVGMHQDDGLGLLLNWLLHIEDLSGYSDLHPAQLAVRDHTLDLREGSVFVFNANANHAWISNSKCIIVQIGVSQIRN